GAMQVAADFLLNRDQVGTGLDEGGDEGIRVLDHQVAVDGQLGDRADGLDHGRSEGDVGNEVAVHDIDMDDGAATALGRSYFLGEVREVGGEDGETEFDHRGSCQLQVASCSLSARALREVY